MISLDKCREILGPECTLSDTDLELFRQHLYTLAEIAFEAYPQLKSPKPSISRSKQKVVNFESMLRLLTETEREAALDWIAITVFDEELSREEAENKILADYLRQNDKGN